MRAQWWMLVDEGVGKRGERRVYAGGAVTVLGDLTNLLLIEWRTVAGLLCP